MSVGEMADSGGSSNVVRQLPDSGNVKGKTGPRNSWLAFWVADKRGELLLLTVPNGAGAAYSVNA